MYKLSRYALENAKSIVTLPGFATPPSHVMAFATRPRRPLTADFSNQLDLFSGVATDSVLEVTAHGHLPKHETPDARENPIGTNDSKPLAEHRPQLVEGLRSQNQLENALLAAEERTADLLYELVSVEKMEYQEAWEISTQEWGFLPSEDRPLSSADLSESLQSRPPATSE